MDLVGAAIARVHPTVPAKSVHELVALARKDDKLTAGSNGAGTTSFLAVEMLNQATGLQTVNVTYKGGGPAITALIGGEVDFEFATACPRRRILNPARSGRSP